MDDRLHPITPIHEAPAHFTFPFNYTPHPLCVAAAAELQQYLAARTEWKEETDGGKMFGVLVVKDEQSGHLGFLAAYSGLLAGRNDWQYFVPPVFDSQQPDGYFKTHEREISAINAMISQMQKAPELCALRSNLADARKRAEAEAEAYRQLMKDAKAERDRRRNSHTPPTPDEDAAMKRESQFQKAELRRIRKRHDEAISNLRQSLDALEAPIARLKQKRKQMSDDLQHWLFFQYNILNAATSATSSAIRRKAYRHPEPATAVPQSSCNTPTATVCTPSAWQNSGGASRPRPKSATTCTIILPVRANASPSSDSCSRAST